MDVPTQTIRNPLHSKPSVDCSTSKTDHVDHGPSTISENHQAPGGGFKENLKQWAEWARIGFFLVLFIFLVLGFIHNYFAPEEKDIPDHILAKALKFLQSDSQAHILPLSAEGQPLPHVSHYLGEQWETKTTTKN